VAALDEASSPRALALMADDEELICVGCDHPESEHKIGGYDPGCHHMKITLDSQRQCTCPGFIRPSPRQQRSGNYRRPSFTKSSSSKEIGTPAPSATSYRQASSLTNLTGSKDREEVPEWVMFGIKQSDGSVTIYASTKLSNLSLRQDTGEFDRIYAELIESGRIEGTPWDLRGRMVGYITARAKNYVDALRDLMTRGWKPDGNTEPTTEDLQRQAALEDAETHERHEADRKKAVEAPIEEIIDAEVVEEDE